MKQSKSKFANVKQQLEYQRSLKLEIARLKTEILKERLNKLRRKK